MKPLFALIGAPNSGKTTLFNRLTGMHLAVGNRAGVTVGAQTGAVAFEGRPGVLCDLPGLYSLCPQGRDEQAARDFLLHAVPSAVVCVVRADALARGLLLALEAMEWGAPMLVALTMTDIPAKHGLTVDAARLSALLGVPVIPVGDLSGRRMLLGALFALGKRPVKPPVPVYAAPVQQAWTAAADLFPPHHGAYWAMRALEGDPEALQRLTQEGQARLQAIGQTLKTRTGQDAAMAVLTARYARCDACEAACLVPMGVGARQGEGGNVPVYEPPAAGGVEAIPLWPAGPGRLTRTILSPFFSLFLLVGLPALIFFVTFGPFGQFWTGCIGRAVERLGGFAANALGDASALAATFVRDCLTVQTGALLGFLPQIALLSYFMTLLEDSGLMAYLAVPADRIMRRCGLNGAAFVPLLMGFGCTVPALLAVRALPDADMRRRTRHLLPMVPCGARLPMLGLLSTLFFGSKGWLILALMLFLSLFALFVTGAALAPSQGTFLMELPRWHLPRGVFRKVFRRCASFLRKCGAIVLLVGVPLWMLQRFSAGGALAADPADSLLAAFGRHAAPLMLPLGLNQWQMVTSLLCGLAAKESAVSALLLLCGGESGVLGLFTPQSALVYLTFFTLYTPCAAAVTTHVRESERFSHSVRAIAHGLLIAYTAAAVVRLIAGIVL